MPNDIDKISLSETILMVVVVSLVVGAIAGVALKFVGESVFKYRVTFLDAFKASLTTTFILTAAYVAFVRAGLVSERAGSGIAIQVIGLLSGVVLLAFTISIFVKSPEGKRPEFAQSGVAAAIVQVVLLVLQIAIATLVPTMTGRA